jgi:hypothetical protein
MTTEALIDERRNRPTADAYVLLDLTTFSGLLADGGEESA